MLKINTISVLPTKIGGRVLIRPRRLYQLYMPARHVRMRLESAMGFQITDWLPNPRLQINQRDIDRLPLKKKRNLATTCERSSCRD